MQKKALFLDRDGVINIEKNYLYKIEDFEFCDGIFELCRYFQNRGYLIFVITNQSGIARGYYSDEDFQKLTHFMLKAFKREGIDIASVKYCPHHPNYSGTCECRKPSSGMIDSLAKEFDIDLASSILIGDKISDIQAGKNANIGLNCLIESNKLESILEIIKDRV